jgi:hypothetical protein
MVRVALVDDQEADLVTHASVGAEHHPLCLTKGLSRQERKTKRRQATVSPGTRRIGLLLRAGQDVPAPPNSLARTLGTDQPLRPNYPSIWFYLARWGR